MNDQYATGESTLFTVPQSKSNLLPSGPKNTSGGKNYYQCDKTKISLVECQAGYCTFPRHMFNELIRQRLQKKLNRWLVTEDYCRNYGRNLVNYVATLGYLSKLSHLEQRGSTNCNAGNSEIGAERRVLPLAHSTGAEVHCRLYASLQSTSV